MRAAVIAMVGAGFVAGTSGCDFQMGSSTAGESVSELASGGERGDAESTGAADSSQPAAATSAPATRRGQIPHRQTQASDGSRPQATPTPSEARAAAEEGSSENSEGCFDAEHNLRCPESEVQEAYEQLQEAARQLEALEEFRIYDRSIPDLDEIRTKLALIQQAKSIAAQVRPFYERFRQRYLTNRPDWMDESSAMNERFQEIDFRATGTLATVEVRLERIEAAPATNAVNCLEMPRSRVSGIDSTHELYRVRYLNESLTALDLCPRFDPDNAEVAARAEEMRPRVAAVLEQYREQELEAARERRWEGSIGRISAGNPGALARAGLGFLRNHRNWGRSETETRVVAVSVRGDWFVASRDLLGRPAQWGLPVHVAVIKPDTHEQMAQVYELSLVTTGRNKGGNFGEYRVGNTWRIMRSALPRGAR